MTISEQKSEGYITLKEASERFGYTPDYVGQLIRKGKIEGKQVYANVAWMTTIKAMEEYVAGNADQKGGDSKKPIFTLENIYEVLTGTIGKWALGLMFFAAICVMFALVFVFASITSDRTRNETEARKNAAIEQVVNYIQTVESTEITDGQSQKL